MNSSQVASRESTVAPNGSLGEPGDRLHENQLGHCVGTSDGTRRPAGVAPAGETALAVPFDNGQAPACLTYSPFIRANARLRGHPSSQSADPAGESLQVSAHIGIVDQNRWGRGHRQGVVGSNSVAPGSRQWPGCGQPGLASVWRVTLHQQRRLHPHTHCLRDDRAEQQGGAQSRFAWSEAVFEPRGRSDAMG